MSTTAKDALRYGIARLHDHHCAGADPTRDAELLLAHAMRTSKESLAKRPERILSPWVRLRYMMLIARRARHTPVAHLTGNAWFFGRPFRITRHTLIPRPATESLVEEALTTMPDAEVIVDVGTGSGAVAITCAHERPNSRIFATDISRHALRTARKNARQHDVDDRIHFLRGDLITDLKDLVQHEEKVLIIANLPYLPEEGRDELDLDVVDHEPASALFGGPDGLDPTRALIDQIAVWTSHPLLTIAVELLPEQCAALAAYADKKIPDLAVRTITNDPGISIGVVLTVR